MSGGNSGLLSLRTGHVDHTATTHKWTQRYTGKHKQYTCVFLVRSPMGGALYSTFFPLGPKMVKARAILTDLAFRGSSGTPSATSTMVAADQDTHRHRHRRMHTTTATATATATDSDTDTDTHTNDEKSKRLGWSFEGLESTEKNWRGPLFLT